MAYTTEKNYTQSGSSNRDFNVTFPFLATTDIKVQKNGVTQTLNSDYTIVQSGGNTVVNFNTAPADTNTIRLFRDTDIDAMQATFAAGSSIRSTDLNTNNTQLLYAAQEFGTLKDDNSVSFSLGSKGDVTVNSSSDWVINPNSIELGMMTDNSVGTTELVNESVTAAKLADFAITASELASNSVTEVKINNGAVSNAKLADNSVSTTKIQDGAVTPAKLSTSSDSGFGFVPIGSVIWYAGNSAPTGYIKANGDSIPNGVGTVQGVSANFSTLYGIVGGNVPDLRGEFIRGLDDSRGVDSSRGIRTAQSAANTGHTHNISATSTSTVNDSGHTHKGKSQTANSTQADGHSLWVNDRANGNYGSGSGDGGGPLGNREFLTTDTSSITVSTSTSISETSNGVANDGRPRNVALLACIKY